jgi:hypothetical protein
MDVTAAAATLDAERGEQRLHPHRLGKDPLQRCRAFIFTDPPRYG